LDAFAPDAVKGKRRDQKWAIEEMKYAAQAAKNIG
jgi:hypothetical protein